MNINKTIDRITKLGCEQNTHGVASACIVLLSAMKDEMEDSAEDKDGFEVISDSIWMIAQSLTENMGAEWISDEANKVLRKTSRCYKGAEKYLKEA